MRTYARYAAGFGLLLLAGCSSVAPIQQDQPIYLQPGQGLMAVVLDTLDPITQVIIDPGAPGGAKIDIPTVPAGINVYLYPVPAGDYCFTAFQYGNWHFKGEQGQLACFQVKAGELGYSGSLAPRVDNGQVKSHQDMDLEGFRTLMNQRYPIIAKQFLPPPAPQGPPPAPEPAVQAAPSATTGPPPALAKLTPRTPVVPPSSSNPRNPTTPIPTARVITTASPRTRNPEAAALNG
jgi:hypothetical protein